ncbi:MAG: hypothetical protein Q8P85_10230 [Pseudomonas sp.]|nr:hypothetical protein [Pseudomonas sp.]
MAELNRGVLSVEQEQALEAKRVAWNRAQQPKWREKRDRDGKVVPGCWVTDSGYTVAMTRLPEARFTITRPGGVLPFAYTDLREQVPALITADMAESIETTGGVA